MAQIKPILTIIVPVYNVEHYICRCLDSILKQNNTLEYEILLIDDGSTDNSSDICDKYAVKYHNIHVIHKKNNEGVSSARNLGIDNAHGDWICFIDADDWVEKDYIETIKKFIDIFRDADLIEFGFRNILEDGKEVHSVFSDKVYNDPFTFIRSSQYKHVLWNYIFKRNIINDNRIRFVNNLKYSEDQNFILKYIFVSQLIIVDSHILYNYCYRRGSAVNSQKTYDQVSAYMLACLDFIKYIRKRSINEDRYENYILQYFVTEYFYYLDCLKDKKKQVKNDLHMFSSELKKLSLQTPLLISIAGFNVNLTIYLSKLKKFLKRLF